MKNASLAGILLLTATSQAHAATYYFDPDAASCTWSAARADDYAVSTAACGAGTQTVFAELQTAIDALSSGDTLYLRAGADAGASSAPAAAY